MGGELKNREESQQETHHDERQAHVGRRVLPVQVVQRHKEERSVNQHVNQLLTPHVIHLYQPATRHRVEQERQHCPAHRRPEEPKRTLRPKAHDPQRQRHDRQSLNNQEGRRGHPTEGQRSPRQDEQHDEQDGPRAKGIDALAHPAWLCCLRNRLFHR